MKFRIPLRVTEHLVKYLQNYKKEEHLMILSSKCRSSRGKQTAPACVPRQITALSTTELHAAPLPGPILPTQLGITAYHWDKISNPECSANQREMATLL